MFLSLLLGIVLLGSGCRSGSSSVQIRAKAAAGAIPDVKDVEEHKETGFPLEGRHRLLACASCHGEKNPKPECSACHIPPHGPKLRHPCESCHTAGHSFAEVKFRHPATGLFAFHSQVDCAQCHQDLKFGTANRDCSSCHADYHKGSVGRDCWVCHRQAEWTVTRFNHNGTGFPLMGTHKALECGDCHRDLQTFRITPRPAACDTCHAGAYRSASFPHAAYGAGRDCQECHLQDTWSYAHSPFWFNIETGQHAGIDCSACHQTAANYRQYSCHQCHQGHTGDRSGRCLDCHPGGFPKGSGGTVAMGAERP